jgi:hypothetical protein
VTPPAVRELLAVLCRFYEIILLDLGTGVTAPIASPPTNSSSSRSGWITNTNVQMALGQEPRVLARASHMGEPRPSEPAARVQPSRRKADETSRRP